MLEFFRRIGTGSGARYEAEKRADKYEVLVSFDDEAPAEESCPKPKAATEGVKTPLYDAFMPKKRMGKLERVSEKDLINFSKEEDSIGANEDDREDQETTVDSKPDVGGYKHIFEHANKMEVVAGENIFSWDNAYSCVALVPQAMEGDQPGGLVEMEASSDGGDCDYRIPGWRTQVTRGKFKGSFWRFGRDGDSGRL